MKVYATLRYENIPRQVRKTMKLKCFPSFPRQHRAFAISDRKRRNVLLSDLTQVSDVLVA